jgi:hypothetical protein
MTSYRLVIEEVKDSEAITGYTPVGGILAGDGSGKSESLSDIQSALRTHLAGGRVMERRVAAPVGAVEVRPGLDELNDHVETASCCRDQERSRPLLRLRIDGGPELEQQTDSGQMTFCRRLEQGRARAIGVAFDVRAPLDKQPYDLVVTLPRSRGQRREAFAAFDIAPLSRSNETTWACP